MKTLLVIVILLTASIATAGQTYQDQIIQQQQIIRQLQDIQNRLGDIQDQQDIDRFRNRPQQEYIPPKPRERRKADFTPYNGTKVIMDKLNRKW